MSKLESLARCSSREWRKVRRAMRCLLHIKPPIESPKEDCYKRLDSSGWETFGSERKVCKLLTNQLFDRENRGFATISLYRGEMPAPWRVAAFTSTVGLRL